jgi:hypothetical protein
MSSSAARLRLLDEKIADALIALSWSPAKARQAVEATSSDGIDLTDRPHLVLLALHLRAEEIARGPFEALRAGQALDPEKLGALLDACRQVKEPGVAARISKELFSLKDPPPLVLPYLAESEALPAVALSRCIEAPDDAVASEAAHVVAWTRTAETARDLRVSAIRAKSPSRSAAFLLAAATLGDKEAVSEIRRRIAEGEQERDLLDGLALVGDERDVQALVRVASKSSELVEVALVVLAQIGSALLLEHLDDIAGAATPSLVQEVRAWVVGVERPVRHRPGVRLFRGEPWAVDRVLDYLQSGEVSPLMRRRTLLELSVRTGVRPLPFFEVGAPSHVQERVCEQFAQRLAGQGARYPRGRWLYYGRPST